MAEESEEATLTELVAAIRGGDPSAWPELVERLSGRIDATLARISSDSHLRSDAAAETWRVLFEKLDDVNNPESLPAWASVVARNNLLDLIRRRRRCGPVADIDAVADEACRVDTDQLVEAEIGKALRNAVSRLTPREQAVVEGRVFTDSPESLLVMGRRLGMPTGSIGPTLGRSLLKLRRDPELRRLFSDAGRRSREVALLQVS